MLAESNASKSRNEAMHQRTRQPGRRDDRARLLAAQNAGEHCYTLLREGIRGVATPTAAGL